ncbi:MAG: hypothetical protein LN413_05715 [Candidatus Thermoplasmatota archaeon]|nr:hypothetical protein [Candidatus Thermoplasmatota archaeon]
MAKDKDKPKRKAPDPLPLIGVRGSSSMISLPKTIVVGGAALVATSPRPGHNASPLTVASGKDTFEGATGPSAGVRLAVENVVVALRESPVARIAGGVLIGGLLFGKQIDKRFPGFPIRLGK